MQFLKAFFWEFIQNLPIITGLLLALRFWQQDQWGTAILWAGLGSTIGSLLIRATEAKIVENHQESLPVIVGNIVMMSGLTCLSVAYLTASWGNWLIDGLIGGISGIILAAAQSLVAGEKISLNHCFAFSLSFAITLVGIRWLAGSLPPIIGILVTTTLVTFFITWIDYKVVYTRKANEL